MSYQRAIVNCKRCYALAREITRVEGVTERNFSSICAENDSIYHARNQAMSALEEDKELLRSKIAKDPNAVIGHEMMAETLLDLCVKCDFKEACIAEWFQPAITEDGSV